MDLTFKLAEMNDCDLLYKWTNDDAVRRNSFDSQKIEYENHKVWFANKLNSDKCFIFIVCSNGRPVGQIRIDTDGIIGIISYSVDSQCRGNGYGTGILKEILKLPQLHSRKISKLIGNVKMDNISSQKAFEGAGYKRSIRDDYIEYSILLNRKIGGDPMNKEVKIKDRLIGEGQPVYIIAEMSANHAGDISRAIEIICAAKESGADCIKIQTYTPDTITIDCDNEYFSIKEGTWKGENLYRLYGKAYTPWDWQGRLKEEAEKIGLDFLSTPFDKTAVDFLEGLGIDFYKIASFELVDIPLINYVASKKKPIIMSTGMASLGEIEEAVNAVKSQGNRNLCLLKCSSAYPAIPEDMNLRTIKNMEDTFGIPIGLSDHSMGSIGAVTAVAAGAKIIEKHFCISRKIENPDSSFSMEPDEFKKMVKEIRTVERALGKISYEISPAERENKKFRKSIFIVKDIKKGEILTEENIRVIRPGFGLEPKYFEKILGKRALKDISRGTPLIWSMFE